LLHTKKRFNYDPSEHHQGDDEQDLAEEELTLAAGDPVRILEDADPDGFYQAEHLLGPHAGQCGLAPSTFLRAATAEETAAALQRSARASAAPVAEPAVIVAEVGALLAAEFDYVPEEHKGENEIALANDELTLNEGESNNSRAHTRLCLRMCLCLCVHLSLGAIVDVFVHSPTQAFLATSR